MKQLEKMKRSLFCLLLVLAALAVLTACGSKAAMAADKIELGQKYLTELNYTEAVASFTEAIKLDPDNIQAYMGRAEAYMALGEYDKALADYRFVSGKTEDMPYTRALSYIGQAEVYEKMEQPARAVSDYGLAKALLKASDAGKEENVSEEDVSAKLVQVLYVHAALCETLKNYDTALEDYNDLLELGENTAAKRDEVLSQLGETAEDENGLSDAEEPAEETVPEQEDASASESQPANEETKPEESASRSEQEKGETASSQQEKNDWVTYTETATSFLGGNLVLNVSYGIGQSTIVIEEIENDENWTIKEETTYHLSTPIQSVQRAEKGYHGHTIFYVPEGTVITGAYVFKGAQGSTRYDPETFNWLKTSKILSDDDLTEVPDESFEVGESMTVRKGTMYQMVEGIADGWVNEGGGAVFCVQ